MPRAKKPDPDAGDAPSVDPLEPLVHLCRHGNLFAVQEWIAAGKPVNPVRTTGKKSQRQSPLDIAISLGFHSLVQVLLKAGADMRPGTWKGPLHQALEMRRLDLIRLLFDNGYDLKQVPVLRVFETWDPQIMEFFIEQGMDIETDWPVARALCNRVRTVLNIVMRYRKRFPQLQKQVNVALRFHCRHGDQKWVSLMLWAGADPYDKGSDNPDEPDDEHGLSAMGYAALFGHFDLFKIKCMRLLPEHPTMREVLKWAVDSDNGLPIAEKLIAAGMNPNDQENGGCSALHYYLTRIDWNITPRSTWRREGDEVGIDSKQSREAMRAVHALAKWGARWCPIDPQELKAARKSLLKVIPSYTMELVWIMSKFKACEKETLMELLRTDGMKRHMSRFSEQFQRVMTDWK